MIESAARRLAHELVNRREAINRELSRNGVRFGIYKNGEYHDRLFPYDPVPRIIESDEYDELEKGLKQRVNALNAYLKDIYSDKRIIHDGVVPEEYVYTSAGYFPQVNGVTPPGGIFAHIAGEDLVQGEDGRWWVLEDNLRWCGKDRAWLERTAQANTLLPEEILLLIGNETEGLRRIYKERSDVLATIPMNPRGSASSFNVACAATVMFYEAVRQRAAATCRGEVAGGAC